MRMLARHYLREFLKLFFLASTGLALIMSVLSLIQRIDSFLPHDPSVGNLAYYTLLVLPGNFLYLMPVSALLCSLYTIGRAARNREITAVMAAGGRVRRLLLPFLAVGAVLSLSGFVLEELVVPLTSKAARELRGSMSGKSTPSTYQGGIMWLRAKDGSLVKIDFYIEEEDAFKGMSIFRTGEGRLREIIQAKEARYLKHKNTWVLHDVTAYDTETGEIVQREDSEYAALGSPSVLREEVRKPYELGIFELYRYLKRLKAAGFKNIRLPVELQSKLAYPFVNLLMVVLGVSIAARRNLSGLVAAAIGLLITLAYWFGFTMLLSLGYAGVLNPVVAAWLMPVVLGSLSAYLFTNIPE